jgi:hypothetical protein
MSIGWHKKKLSILGRYHRPVFQKYFKKTQIFINCVSPSDLK